MSYTREEIKNILENDFLLSKTAFLPGHTNDDVVDSMLMCAAIEEEWTELFAKWVDAHTTTDRLKVNKYLHSSSAEREIKRITKHYERVKKWMEKKGWLSPEWYEATTEQERIDKLMGYTINY